MYSIDIICLSKSSVCYQGTQCVRLKYTRYTIWRCLLLLVVKLGLQRQQEYMWQNENNWNQRTNGSRPIKLLPFVELYDTTKVYLFCTYIDTMWNVFEQIRSEEDVRCIFTGEPDLAVTRWDSIRALHSYRLVANAYVGSQSGYRSALRRRRVRL